MEVTYIEAMRQALREEMKRDEAVFVLGEDVGAYGGVFGLTEGLMACFGPKRVRDTPISEAAIMGMASGSAMMGMRPVVDLSFADFVTTAMDQIVNQAAKISYQSRGKLSASLAVCLISGSGTGAACQHSQSLEAWFCHVPGLKVVAPATPYDAKGLLKSVIRDDNPVLFYGQKLLLKEKGEVPSREYTVPIGEAISRRRGGDLTIVTYGRMVPLSLEAARRLAFEGVEAEVVDLRTLAPLDEETILRSVTKTKRLLVVHEACTYGGLGGEIVSLVAESPLFDALKAPPKRLGGQHCPVPFSASLERFVVPDGDQIVAAGRDLVLARNGKGAMRGRAVSSS